MQLIRLLMLQRPARVSTRAGKRPLRTTVTRKMRPMHQAAAAIADPARHRGLVLEVQAEAELIIRRRHT